ncbi:3'-5' exonuclease [Micromonospora sp. 4G57]|uniref:DNA 3'-5' helicase n=1 Tax=Micromonospora sicca TaxID=2202420 RepID=A0ABU5JKF4_9ACTN|nr:MULTISPECIES: UvrD-helicase domain-containing protein [unclassified Micromonospora]MDZ5447077.1 3'-5' exonuclease [Micromonospora sp. 4G57]MDZ5493046.1 3'-5' exonuclease [Micromonospora sp. 4G53]
MAKVNVLFADTFDKAYQSLDATIQRRVVDFMLKLRKDPDASGLNLKQPHGAHDKRVWTARVNDNFRAVLWRPDHTTFYLASIKPHDDAYTYAAQTVWNVNKVTGGVEFYDHGAIKEILLRTGDVLPAAHNKPGFFEKTSDADFARLGIAPTLVPTLREIRTEDALLGIAEQIPALASQVILALADGKTTDQVWAEIVTQSEADSDVDPDDVAAAVERPATRETFAVVTDDSEELERMLLKPMSEWRIFLHPQQRRLAYRKKPYNGPARVSGGPGTGKTVVALHRVKALAAAFPPSTDRKILLTTYTNALSDLLHRLLDDLGGPDLTSKVDVLNIDKVVRDILRNDTDAQWTNVDVLGDAAIAARWNDVITELARDDSFDRPFLISEWEQVVLAQNIRTREQYFSASRAGRGRRITRADRAAIWTLIQEFERRLDRDKALGFKQAAVRAGDITANWTDADRPYQHVVVDEAQDLHAAHWTLLRALAPSGPDDMFIVGDTFQRIYDNRVTLGSLGIDIRGRSSRLTLNYRTTRQILNAAITVIDPDSPNGYDDLDGGSDTLRGYRSVLRGAKPDVAGYSSPVAEMNALVDRVRTWSTAGIPLDEIAVIARTNAVANAAVTALKAAGVEAALIKSGQTAKPEAGVQAMTMHRAKGLEFRAVAIVGAGSRSLPLPAAVTAREADHLDHQRDIQRERSLLFVSATRAREALSITWSGQPSQFLTGLGVS